MFGLGPRALPFTVDADTLTIDLQHGMVDYQAMIPMLQAISTTATVPVVRVPWLEPGVLMKTLDAGAYGVICPMINTREDAQKLVAYTHYAPRGTRSFGPVRALLYGGADYPQHAKTKRTFAPGFRIGLHQKDLNLALQGACTLGVALPQTAGAAQLMQACAAHGFGDLDHSALVKALELMADHPVMPEPAA